MSANAELEEEMDYLRTKLVLLGIEVVYMGDGVYAIVALGTSTFYFNDDPHRRFFSSEKVALELALKSALGGTPKTEEDYYKYRRDYGG